MKFPEIILRALLNESSCIGVMVTDPNGRIQWANPTFVKMCGYPLNELKGETTDNLLYGDLTDPEEINRIRNAIENAQSYTSEIISTHKNGTTYWVHLYLSPIYDDEGLLKNFVVFEQNITQEKQREYERDQFTTNLYHFVSELIEQK